MTQVSEITEQGYTSRKPRQSRSPILNFGAMLLKNPDTLRKFRVMSPDEERYVRPPREYDIPPFHESMKHCTSKEPYLRPTRYCNPLEPEVVAMANELGAYELSDYEFADAAFWFVKSKLNIEMLPLDSVSATLRRGTGTCYHLDSTFIALCRAAGIKARYKTFRVMLPDVSRHTPASEQERMLRENFNQGTPEAEAEVCIDGKWVTGHVAMRPEIYARSDLPIARFGEDAIAVTFPGMIAPGSVKCFESISLSLGIGLKAAKWLAPALMERTGVALQQTHIPLGRKAIEEAGGMEAYDRMARERLRAPPPTIEAKEDTALVFEA